MKIKSLGRKMQMKNLESGQNKIVLNPIGYVKTKEEEGKFWVEIKEEFRPALKELENFSHAHIIWWANKNDNKKARSSLVSEQLPPFYGNAAPSMGNFATRSEYRPNPVLITTCPLINVDKEKGIITVPWMDAFDGSPVVDIKPYLQMSDLVNEAKYPVYLQHWPKSQEEAVKWFSDQIAQANQSEV